MKQKNNNVSTKMDIRTVALWGLGISLLIGFVDLIYTIIQFKPHDFDSLGTILAFSLIPAIIFSIIYFLVWFVILVPATRLFNLSALHLNLMFSIFYGTAFSLIIITDSFRIGSFSSAQLLKIGLSLAGALATALLFFLFTRKITSREKLLKMSKKIISFLVIFGFQALVYTWFFSYLIPSGLFWLILCTICALLLTAFTILFFKKKKPRISPVSILSGLLLIIVIWGGIQLILLDLALGDDLIIEKIQQPEEEPAVSRILLLTIDTLRPDFLTCYNSQAGPTPNIDQLAEDGIMFHNAISPSPWTAPSLASLMTGVPCMVHAVDNTNVEMQDNLTTLAEVMKESGYITGAMVCNALLSHSSGFPQGFNYYRYFPKFPHGYCLGSKVLSKLFPDEYIFQVNSASLASLAIKWMREHKEDDFFFWLHFLDPHLPYAPPRRYLTSKNKPPSLGYSFDSLHEIRDESLVLDQTEKEWVKELYRAEVRYVDDQIGKIIKTLKSSGIYDETLIVLLSDHGEEFWEHGGFEHGHTLYNELLRVPLIIKLPGSRTSTVIYNSVTSILSIRQVMPTMLDLCGIEKKFRHPYTESLQQYWTTSAFRNQDQIVYSSSMLYGPEKASVIFDRYKFITALETEERELYNLYQDPGEYTSLTDRKPELTEKGADNIARFQLKTRKERIGLGLIKDRKVSLDEETRKRLRALGYIK